MNEALKHENLMRFLLVEDDEDHAQIVFRSLRKECVANLIDHVCDGVEALAYLRKEGRYKDKPRPDIVLLDLKLPKMDGHEVLAAIKNEPSLCDIPVIVLTTSDAEKDMAKAYTHHANSYLVKPLNAACFRKMIEDVRLYWGNWNRSPHRHVVEACPTIPS